MRFRQLLLFSGLVAAASAASFGACLSGGARPSEVAGARPSGDLRLAPDGAAPIDAATGEGPTAPDAALGEPLQDASRPALGAADAGAPPPAAAAAPPASCRASRVVMEAPPADGVVFNNAMTSADAGYVDRTALVLGALAEQTSRVGCCLELVPADELGAAGALLIVIELDPKGSVTQAFVEKTRSSPLPDAVTGCVAATVRELRYPRSPTDRVTVVEYPLKWRRSDA